MKYSDSSKISVVLYCIKRATIYYCIKNVIEHYVVDIIMIKAYIPVSSGKIHIKLFIVIISYCEMAESRQG